MSWGSATVEEKRREFVMLANAEGANVSELCRRFGISRQSGYKWKNRGADSATPTTWADRSRRPLYSPTQTAAELEQQVLTLRDAHPAWGGRKIAHVLLRDHALTLAASTITSILRRHGRIDAKASVAAQHWQRFEHAEPNSLWQMDFKGHFAIASGRCHPLTVLDDHSRYNLVLAACVNEQRQTVAGHLQRAFERYGLPERVNTDNGPPWGNQGEPYLTQLGVWLVRLGIRVGRSRPAHPQTNGKDERFHRSLKAEVLAGRVFNNLDESQAAFDRWRWVYNHYRPHESLGMHTPSQRYRASSRAFPAILPTFEYASDDQVRKVQDGGWISFKGHSIRVGSALHGLPVALRPNATTDGLHAIYFCHQKILTVNLNEL
jgi:transposase InsO family protein